VEYKNRTIFDVICFGNGVAEVVEVLESDLVGKYGTGTCVCKQVAPGWVGALCI
jgi:hypothetical protein